MSEFRNEPGSLSRGLWQWELPSQDFLYRDLPVPDPATQIEYALTYIRNRYANGFMTLESYPGPAIDGTHRHSHGQGIDENMWQDENQES